ncbi:MAG TPA: GspH/FimT family pseudopilin [Methylobacter sp.]|jgi:type IV fimbrial biogenesis protein FimT
MRKHFDSRNRIGKATPREDEIGPPNNGFFPSNELLEKPRQSTEKVMNRFANGFTLIELMITLAIVAILMVIGIPSYQSLITGSNITTESTSLMGDLQYARSQAIKQGLPVSVCAANTSGGAPYTCSGLSNWAGGWVTYTNNPPTNTVTNSVLRVQQPLTSSDTMTSTSATALSSVSFNNFGFSTIKGSVTVSPLSGSVASKTVCVSGVGNVQSVAGGDSLCP